MNHIRNPAFLASIAVIFAAIGVPIKHELIEAIVEVIAALLGIAGIVAAVMQSRNAEKKE
jgi:uncharacterized membrane protein